MKEKTTRVTVLIREVAVTVDCPHNSVDDETIFEAAMTAIRSGETVGVVPRFNDGNPQNGPLFKAYVEVMDDHEIEDDDRAESPEEFDARLKWWRDLNPQPKD